MFKTNLLAIGSFDVKVLGTIAISDRDFIFCFACLFIYLFISERINTETKVYFDLISGHLETAS